MSDLFMRLVYSTKTVRNIGYVFVICEIIVFVSRCARTTMHIRWSRSQERTRTCVPRTKKKNTFGPKYIYVHPRPRLVSKFFEKSTL